MDTKLFVRQRSGGYFSTIDRELFPNGNIWWVDSTNTTYGSDASGYGANPDAPFLTLAYAETAATAAANSGVDDTIFLMPGHTETLTGNPSLTLDVAGLKVIGLGGPTRKPALLIDGAATAHIVLSGADTVLENVTLKSGHADIAKAILVSAVGVTVRNCWFLENVATENFLICVLGGGANACDYLTVEGCYAIQPDASNTHFISLPSNETGVKIRGNDLHGDWGTAAIGAAGDMAYITVKGNDIYNIASDADSCIELAGTNTGNVAFNNVSNAAAKNNQITAAGCNMCENYAGISADDTQGIYDPVVTP